MTDFTEVPEIVNGASPRVQYYFVCFSLFQNIHVQMKTTLLLYSCRKFQYYKLNIKLRWLRSQNNNQGLKRKLPGPKKPGSLTVLRLYDKSTRIYTCKQRLWREFLRNRPFSLVKSSVLGNRGKPKSTSEKSAIDRYEWHAMITQGISNCNLKSQKLKSCSTAKKKTEIW